MAFGVGNYLNFGTRHAGMAERNARIAAALERPGWVLDVGANVGQTANELARQGHFVVGFEVARREAQQARRGAEPQAAFFNVPVTPEVVLGGPRWDAILLLSVLHRIHASGGEAAMRQVLRACGERTGRIIVEGSIRHRRYCDLGQPAPDFPDLDVARATEWHRALLAEELGAGWSHELLAQLPCSKLEPYRLLFLSTRAK